MARRATGPLARGSARERFLLVRAGERTVGFTVGSLRAVVDLGEWHPVPSASEALRGVMPVRGRLVPLYHLASALRGVSCPEARGEMVVLIEANGRTVGYEVEDATEVAAGEVRPPPADLNLPGAVGVADVGGKFLPIIDGEVLALELLQEDRPHDR